MLYTGCALVGRAKEQETRQVGVFFVAGLTTFRGNTMVKYSPSDTVYISETVYISK